MYPILFEVLGFPIRSYGVLMALGVILGVWIAKKWSDEERFKGHIQDFTLYAFLGGLIGARIWEVAFTWDHYANDWLQVFALWNGGLSVQGGLVGGVLAGVWFCKTRGIPVWKFADAVAPGVILGMALGRIGCLLTGDCYGIPTDTFWGISYPPGTIAYQAYGSTPLYPTVGFEAFFDFVILGILFMTKQKRCVDGFQFLLMTGLYSVQRFFLEFLRGDSLRTVFHLKTAQVASVLTIVVVVGLLGYLKKRTKDSAGSSEHVTDPSLL
ncbi:prolipoprotein diacylglyceryl transferase [Effusibacillus pohliae]|uniref:prolipoprotein diacylglyceryl transferase n=1 Tax=Effusibacillus pohliae TaxID=232270 RepID=UPI0003770973|nr:prolipoprotein diacylglyceryl transferase [Effusibacillus pohliae]